MNDSIYYFYHNLGLRIPEYMRSVADALLVEDKIYRVHEIIRKNLKHFKEREL